MISFKHFLNESVTAITLPPEEAARLIAKECSEFIKETEFSVDKIYRLSNAVYRGVDNLRTVVASFDGNIVRPARDSNKLLHKLLDKFFVEHFGFPYRSKGTFVTANETTASGYGYAGIFFPVNGYSYVFSKEIEDAYTAFQNTKSSHVAPGSSVLYKRIIVDMYNEVMKLFDEYLSDNDVNDPISPHVRDTYFASFSRALENGFLPNIENEWFTIVEKWLKRNPKIYQNTGIKELTSSKKRNEIMFSCKKYYLISTDLLEKDNDYRERFFAELGKHL